MIATFCRHSSTRSAAPNYRATAAAIESNERRLRRRRRASTRWMTTMTTTTTSHFNTESAELNLHTRLQVARRLQKVHVADGDPCAVGVFAQNQPIVSAEIASGNSSKPSAARIVYSTYNVRRARKLTIRSHSGAVVSARKPASWRADDRLVARRRMDDRRKIGPHVQSRSWRQSNRRRV